MCSVKRFVIDAQKYTTGIQQYPNQVAAVKYSTRYHKQERRYDSRVIQWGFICTRSKRLVYHVMVISEMQYKQQSRASLLYFRSCVAIFGYMYGTILSWPGLEACSRDYRFRQDHIIIKLPFHISNNFFHSSFP
jgi:hypothetical protein